MQYSTWFDYQYTGQVAVKIAVIIPLTSINFVNTIIYLQKNIVLVVLDDDILHLTTVYAVENTVQLQINCNDRSL